MTLCVECKDTGQCRMPYMCRLPAPPTNTREGLCRAFANFADERNLPHAEPEALMLLPDLSVSDREWLRVFIALWAPFRAAGHSL